MVTLTYNAQGLDETLNSIERMARAGETAQRQVIQALGDRYVEVLQDETPVGRGEKPGRLKQSYVTGESYRAECARYTITNTTPYLRYVLKGRGRVTVKRAKALRFVIDGRVFFRRSVGPAKANNFPPRAAARMQNQINQAADRIGAVLVRSYGV